VYLEQNGQPTQWGRHRLGHAPGEATAKQLLRGFSRAVFWDDDGRRCPVAVVVGMPVAAARIAVPSNAAASAGVVTRWRGGVFVAVLVVIVGHGGDGGQSCSAFDGAKT
jgi:hypothetical protein